MSDPNAQRARRPELREPRTFSVPGFDVEPLAEAVLAKHKFAMTKPELLAALQDGRAVVRRNAALALGQCKPLDASEVQVLAVGLRDTDAEVRVAASLGLRNANECEPAVPFLVDATFDPVLGVAEAARATLLGYGSKVLPPLLPFLQKTPTWFEARVAKVMADQGAAMLDVLVPALENGNPTVRDNALRAFAACDADRMHEVLSAAADRKGKGYDLLRAHMRKIAAKLAAAAEPSSKEPRPFALPGFDTDLIAAADIAKAKAKLPRGVMVEALRDGRVAVRVNALQALLAHAPLDEAETTAVAVLAKDSSASVRSAACRALAGAKDVLAALPVLLEASGDKDATVAQDAAVVIASHGPKVIEPIVRMLQVEPEIADRTLLPHLVAQGEAARMPLVRVLHHPDARVRANALAGLTSLGADALVQSNAQVIVMTRDQDPAVRGLARQALGIIARATRPHMAEVRPLPLEDFATKVVEEVELKKASKKLSVDALLALTRDGRETVRVNAWRGLQALGSLDESGALQAAVACKDGDPVVRREAALTLRGCPEDALPQVLPVLVNLSRDPEKAPAQAAKQIVYSFGKRAVPHLLHLFAAREGHVNSEAVKLAVALSDDSTPAILAALDSPLPLVRENALHALGQIGGKALDGALDKVMARTADSHDSARLAALQAVMQMTPATWSKPLSDKRLGTVRDVAKRMSREDSRRVVREAAVTLIGHLDLTGA